MSLQGTEGWFQSRLGKVTASRVSDILAKPRNGTGSGVRQSYMNQLIEERTTGQRNVGYQTTSMQWGIQNEPKARDAYCKFRGVSVAETGFIDHPTIPWSGASPDGLVGHNGLVEIKCPNTKSHLAVIKSAKIPSQYYYQIMWQMAVTGREWCDFVSFDPRLNDSRRLYVQRILRDSVAIDHLHKAVSEFVRHVEARLVQENLEKPALIIVDKVSKLMIDESAANEQKPVTKSSFDCNLSNMRFIGGELKNFYKRFGQDSKPLKDILLQKTDLLKSVYLMIEITDNNLFYEIAEIFYDIGNLSSVHGRFDSHELIKRSIWFLQEGLKLNDKFLPPVGEDTKYLIQKSSLFHARGQSHESFGNIDSAIDDYYCAINVIDTVTENANEHGGRLDLCRYNAEKDLADLLNSEMIGRSQEALPVYKRILTYWESLFDLADDPMEQDIIYYSCQTIAEIEDDLGNLEEAKRYFIKGLVHANAAVATGFDAAHMQYEIGVSHLRLGQISEALSQMDDAHHYYDEAFRIVEHAYESAPNDRDEGT